MDDDDDDDDGDVYAAVGYDMLGLNRNTKIFGKKFLPDFLHGIISSDIFPRPTCQSLE